MLLTNDQRFLLDILREVRYMRLDQILPLMRLRDPAKAKSHCEAILRYLRYAGELVPVGDDLVCLAEFRGQEADPEMLCALDILLSLAVGPPLQLTSRRPPYKSASCWSGEGRVGKSTHSRSCRWSRDGNSLSASFWRSSLRM